MKKLVLPLAIVGMLLLLAGAVVLDCLRYAGDARHRIALADEELRKHEQRLVELSRRGAKHFPRSANGHCGVQSRYRRKQPPRHLRAVGCGRA